MASVMIVSFSVFHVPVLPFCVQEALAALPRLPPLIAGSQFAALLRIHEWSD
jgi:hypothetical protein